MRRYWVRAIAAVVLQALGIFAACAQTPEDFPCEAFRRNADGSWTVTHAAFLLGPNFSVRVGAVFRPGEPVRGFDLVGKLEQSCRDYVPPAAPAGAEQAQQPFTSLSRYVDANGNLEVSRLSCGHLADTSAQEAEMLLTWYAGSLDASAKKRVFNMAHLRYATRTLIAYCKANREQNLVKAMNLILK